MKTKIKAIGFEIEGEFKKVLIDKIIEKEGGKFVEDGSLERCGGCENLELLEYNSPVIPIAKAEEKIENIFKIFSEHRSDYHYNDTMGVHLHLSFTPQNAPEIWSSDFYSYFMGWYKKTFTEFYQKRYKNSFCLDHLKCYSEHQSISDFYGRYGAINFREAFLKHKTIEIRIMPATSPTTIQKMLLLGIKRVQMFLNQVNNNNGLNYEIKEELETGERVLQLREMKIKDTIYRPRFPQSTTITPSRARQARIFKKSILFSNLDKTELGECLKLNYKPFLKEII